MIPEELGFVEVVDARVEYETKRVSEISFDGFASKSSSTLTTEIATSFKAIASAL